MKLPEWLDPRMHCVDFTHDDKDYVGHMCVRRGLARRLYIAPEGSDRRKREQRQLLPRGASPEDWIYVMRAGSWLEAMNRLDQIRGGR